MVDCMKSEGRHEKEERIATPGQKAQRGILMLLAYLGFLALFSFLSLWLAGRNTGLIIAFMVLGICPLLSLFAWGLFSWRDRARNKGQEYSLSLFGYGLVSLVLAGLAVFTVVLVVAPLAEPESDGAGMIYLLDAVVLVMMITGAYARYQARKRMSPYETAALGLGLDYQPLDTFPSLFASYQHLNMVPPSGGRRDAFLRNIVSGNYLGHDIFAFDLGKQFSGGIIQLEGEFPELKAWPADHIDLGLWVVSEAPEVDFDNMEFSKKYNVKSRDKKFAYDVFHPRMMEYFLGLEPGIWMEIEKNTMMLVFVEPLDPGRLKEQLDRFVSFREQLPNYLFSVEQEICKAGKEVPPS